MAFIPALRTAKITLNYLQFGQALANTLWAQLPTGFSWDEGHLVAGAEAVADWWDANIKALCDGDLTLNTVHVRDWETSTGGQYLHSANIAGTLAGTASPTVNTFTIAFKSLLSGRNYQGRNYIVGLNSVQVANNQIVKATADAYITAYYALPIALNTIEVGCRHVVASTVEDHVERTNAVLTPVQSYVYVDLNLDSQRRRLTGRGN